jgi:hypothetical protein
MKSFVLFFICVVIHFGESRPREGFIWPNATLWPNATIELLKRNHVPDVADSTQGATTNIDIHQGNIFKI